MANSKKTIQQITTAVNTASTALTEAKAELEEAIASEELGSIITIDKIPQSVQEDEDGKKFLKCEFSKRQIAMLHGKAPPPVRKRAPKAVAAE